MKLLIYENSAGFSSYTYKLCNALKRENTTNEIVYLTQKNNHELDDLDNRITLCMDLLPYDGSKKHSLKWLINRIRVSVFNIKMRNAMVKKGKYDVVSIQATIPIFDQFYINRLKKYAKVVYTVHDVMPPIKSFYYSKRSLKKLYNLVDEIIVHSQQNKNQMIELFGIDEKKIKVVFHGTDSNYILHDRDSCREKFGISKNKTVFLFYGLIREQKGLSDLIEAMQDIPDSQLVIAGAVPFGESFDKYKKMLDEFSVDCVKFIRYIPREWEDELFQACDFVCLPYRWFYSQSGVFMQCLKYRKPVIISDVSSFREYLSEYKIGFLSKPCDVNDLREKIIKAKETLIYSKELYENELNRAAADCSWEKSAQRHMEIFEEVLKGGFGRENKF